ncbi:MAG: 7,8-didemethyl-8-hydroxy-5-deazariboflavin synthase CofG [Deltaproteobacteria bacterium]
MSLLHNEMERLFNSEGARSMLQALGIGPAPAEASARLRDILDGAVAGEALQGDDALFLAETSRDELAYLLAAASQIRESGKPVITYSKNVFIPLTRLCRDHCGYCTFKYEPHEGELFMTPEQVMEKTRAAVALGCTELLFVTGDKPELKYPVYREALARLGYKSTAEYLTAMSEAGLNENIFPHTNMGVAKREELALLREWNASQGLMLETISERLLKKGEAHYRSPDKVPKLRIRTTEFAGELRIPWTSGILVGIGETVDERVGSLLEIKRLAAEYGHIQEIIIQNFNPKHGILMHRHLPAALFDMIKTVAVARIMFGSGMNIQIPPNLNLKTYPVFIFAGANDLGGVSPLTIDYVNPECPWPQLERMEKVVSELGFGLRERLPVYPEFIGEEFLSRNVLERVGDFVDDTGFVMTNGGSTKWKS